MKNILRCLLIALLMCLPFSAVTAEEDVLSFSLESGFYEHPMPLSILCDVRGVSIYYTTDGTVPDEDDYLYEDTITLLYTTNTRERLARVRGTSISEDWQADMDFPSAHVIRAVAIGPDGARSNVVSGTFFIGYDREILYGNFPIMSLMLEEDALFDYETGIYVLGKAYDEWKVQQTGPYESWQTQGNYSQRGRDWERAVTVEYLPYESEGFTQDMGVRIKGAASRANTQKSLRLIAREDYGEKQVKYQLFPDHMRQDGTGLVNRYKSFTLRNGGNDCDFGKIRDPYIQRLATGMNFTTAATMPCIAFINGEYWGLYTLHEEYSDNYIENHYEIDNNNVVTVKNSAVEDGEEEDIDLYKGMFDFITENDMSDPALYAQAGEMLDMASFIDYLALNLYIYNEDGIFANNNWQMWRVRVPGEDDAAEADGKWRMMVFDTDYSSGIYNDGKNFATDNLSPVFTDDTEYDYRHPLLLIRSLMANEVFRRQLVMALCDVRNFYFEQSRAGALLDEMTAQYLPYVPDTFRRFGPAWVAQWNPENHFTNELKQIGTFFDGRYKRFPWIIKKGMGLTTEPRTVTLSVSDSAKGSVQVNGRMALDLTNPLECKYFKEYPITLTAIPEDGATFVGWEVTGEGCTLSDPTALTAEVSFESSFGIKAIFE